MTIPSSPEPSAGPRRTVATYDSYADAERAVDWLSDQGFPVERALIVGTGLRYVERIAGRVTTGRAALSGAAQGAVLGLIFALLFGIFFTLEAGSFLGVLLYGLVAGAVFGAVLAAVAHAAQGGRRDFASAAGTQADAYELQVEEAVAADAEELLRSMPAVRR